MKIHFLQHVPFENPGMILRWAKQRGFNFTSTLFFEKNYILPEQENFDALIVMGGSMGVYDETMYPWIANEKNFIKQSINAGKHVLGICLGAQMIAATLGAKIAPNTEKEIGWFPVTATEEGESHLILEGLAKNMMVFHWHGDRFEIPTGAIRLMSSLACDNQAFAYGEKVLGLQFHLEMDCNCIEKITKACAGELKEGRFVQSARTMLNNALEYQTEPILYRILDNWIHA